MVSVMRNMSTETIFWGKLVKVHVLGNEIKLIASKLKKYINDH